MYKRHCHVFELKDQWYLFDVRSAAASMISPETADIMLLLDPLEEECVIKGLSGKYKTVDLKTAWDELCRIGFLANQKQKSKRIMERNYDMPIPNFTFHLAHDCDLRCKYCYAEDGTYSGPRGLMTKPVAEKALDLLFSQNSETLGISFFGGEPLLNYELLKWIVSEAEKRAAAQKKYMQYIVSTNGTLLTGEVVKYLEEHNINIAISLDGPPEIHDRLRPNAFGKGSYDKIYNNIKPLIENNKSFSARATFCGDEIVLAKVVKHFSDLGIKSFGGGFALEPNSAFSVTEQQLGEVKKQLLEAIDDIIANQEHDAANTFGMIQEKVNILKGRGFAMNGCGAGERGVSVTPDGTIYPCHRLINFPELAFGTVDGIDKTKRNKYLEGYYNRLDNCSICWAHYLCGSRCIYQSFINGKGIEELSELSCSINKLLWEVAIYSLCKTKKHEAEERTS